MCVSEEKELLLKAEGVADCVKWMQGKIKETKKEVESNKKNCYGRDFSMYSYSSESCNLELTRSKIKLEEQVAIKQGLEKYMKKLRHQSRETSENIK